MENEFCIKADGSVEILISADGLPSAVGIFPTIIFKQENRLREVLNMLDSYALRGYWVDGWKWIKNQAFDRKGEKTSVEVRFRVCKTRDEALVLVERIKEIVNNLGGEI